MTRRELLTLAGAAALGFTLRPRLAFGEDTKNERTKKVLFFTKSSAYEHSVIKRRGSRPSFAEQILAAEGPKHGFEFVFSKDGSLFSPAYFEQFDALFFYTSGDLSAPGTDKHPGVSPEGKKALLDAIAGGKGFVGCHSAADTFHTGETVETDRNDRSKRYQNYGEASDPYIRMLGGEFIRHGRQQKARLRVASAALPGFDRLRSLELTEEWYSFKDYADDLHVLLVQETAGMVGVDYERGPYPATWARRHDRGRVFYTSLGHREDVWTNPSFQDILFSGLGWASGGIQAEIKPNIAQVTPRYREIPPKPSENA